MPSLLSRTTYTVARRTNHTFYILSSGVAIAALVAQLVGDISRAAVLASYLPTLMLVNSASALVFARLLIKRINDGQ